MMKVEPCNRCPLSERRTKMAVYRGDTKPLDALFIGEFPSREDDALGEPFIGPIGHLLDDLIYHVRKLFPTIKIGITNIIWCAPFTSSGELGVPLSLYVDRCQQNLINLIEHYQPTFLVAIGEAAEDKLAIPFTGPDAFKRPIIRIFHPSFILRKPVDIQPVLVLQQVAELVDVFDVHFQSKGLS